MRNPRGKGLDWDRVTEILGAKRGEELVACRLCKAKGSVPYIAEHTLTAHPASRTGRELAKLVLRGQQPPKRDE